MNSDYQSVIRANQELHTVLAGSYDANEPHFRPENIAHVEGRLKELFADTSAKRMVDLGCGTGFVINIAKTSARPSARRRELCAPEASSMPTLSPTITFGRR